ncbi:EamA domain-containing protein [Citrus sinensis]|uniref:EamA domain-containing protein n=1 Tax=Citrus sinensis TaxID=2711 RepID=A0ACB8N627_CITSI|nr:EamA domain-containing protein [Citrus sinensis]
MSSKSTESSDGDQATVELIVCNSSPSAADGGGTASDEIAPLLAQSEKPKTNIFSVSYTRRKPREHVIETDTSLTNCMLWVWNGSRYSGLMCMALSSTIYFFMQVISDVFMVQSIPLFETVFTRCTVTLILSYLWLRRSGQPIFGSMHARNLLVLRALVGFLSLFSFVYSIQRLPLSQATVLSFTAPIMASIAARIILRLALSFFGVLFIFRRILTTQGREVSLQKLFYYAKNGCHAYVNSQVFSGETRFICAYVAIDTTVSGGLVKPGEAISLNVRGSDHMLAVLVGLFSSITGGISYCLIKAGANASDQPLVTVFSFGILASPAAGICLFFFEEFVLPSFYSFLLMLVLSILAFFAEVLLARGLQLEKTSKVANVQYIEVALTQLWGMGLSRIAPSFGRLVGCVLILVSVFYTMYIGPEKEMNDVA